MELAAGRVFGVDSFTLEVRGAKDIRACISEPQPRGRADALLVLQSPVFVNERTQLADLAVKSRLPGDILEV